MPNQLHEYLRSPIICSTYQIQELGSVICGQLSIYVLKKLEEGNEFVNVLLSLVDEI